MPHKLEDLTTDKPVYYSVGRMLRRIEHRTQQFKEGLITGIELSCYIRKYTARHQRSEATIAHTTISLISGCDTIE